VEAAFAHRRKTLANALELAGAASRADAQSALNALGIRTDARAESLPPESFVALEQELGRR
jgi:16S rRNA (adenine1518-N6/adenine1519-N6)-dimethyltransferase